METLREHLQQAIELEHALIPPYLCALYSLDRKANPAAASVVASVVIDEMFHMATAANILNAVGGRRRRRCTGRWPDGRWPPSCTRSTACGGRPGSSPS